MRAFSFTSLRSRLIFLMLLALLPAFALVIYTAVEQRRSGAISVQQDALKLARLIASEHRQITEGARQLLTSVGQLPDVRKGNQAACSRMFADLVVRFPRYSGFSVADLNGDVICTAILPAGGSNVAQREYFKRALEKRDFVIGEYRLGRFTGKPIVTFAHPLLDPTGKIEIVVSAFLDLDWLNQLAAKVQLPEGAMMNVIHRDGTVLARYPNPEKWLGKSFPDTPLLRTILKQGEGTTEVTGLDGIMRLFAFTPLGETSDSSDAYISIGLPHEVAFAKANQLLTRNLVALGIVSLLALLAAMAVGEFFVRRPVNLLLDASNRLAAGDLTARIGSPLGSSEFSRLARSFNEMAEALQRQEATRKEAEDALRARYRDLETLNGISQTVLNSLDLKTALEKILDKTLTMGDYDIGNIRLFDSKGQLVTGAFQGYHDPENTGKHHKSAVGPESGLRVPQVVAARKTFVVEDISAGDGLRTLKREGVQSAIVFPVFTQTQVLGVVEIGSRMPRKFHADEIRFLEMIGNQIGIAVQKDRLYEETRGHLERIRVLYEINLATTSTLKLGAVLDFLLEKIEFFLPYPTITSVRLLNPETGLLEPFACRNIDISEWTATMKRVGRVAGSVNNAVMASKTPIAISDIGTDPRSQHMKFLKQHGVVSCLALPLIAQNEAFGALNICSKERHEFTSEEVDFLFTLAGQTAIAIHNAQFYEQIKKQAVELENSFKEAEAVKQELMNEISEHKQARQALLTYQEQLRSLASELSLTEGRERQRMATYLHDHIGQILALTKIKLGMLQGLPSSAALTEPFDEICVISKLIEQTICEIRTLTFELSPPLLHQNGLEATLGWLAEEMGTRYGIVIDVMDDGKSKPLDEDVGLFLFHAVRELIVNAFKHAKAGNVKVSVSRAESLIKITVEDGGVGFDVSKLFSHAGRPVGFGLFNIRERSVTLGGYFQVQSQPGHGTMVTLLAPLKRDDKTTREQAA